MDREAAARAIEALLHALGKKPEGELAQTPELVAAAWCDELLQGEAQDPAAILREAALPSSDGGELVALRDLAVSTMCPHHLLPAHGRADVLYVPGDNLVGFGGIARALHACTRRLSLQERACSDMANLLIEVIGARGALCRMRLTHTCLLARGARETEAVVETIATAGSLAEGGGSRQLALTALAGAGDD